jgi:hypothetical protein
VAGVSSIVDRLNRIHAEHEAEERADNPAITFGLDDDRITFRDQAALDEYVIGAIGNAARRQCCGENPSAHHAATDKHSELMAFAGRLARAVRGR